MHAFAIAPAAPSSTIAPHAGRGAAARAVSCVAALVLAGCAHAPAAGAGAATAAPASTVAAGASDAGELAAYAGHPFVVFPLQRVQGEPTEAGEARGAALRATFDGALARAVRERAVGAGWALAEELERSARRNVGYVGDPHALSATGLAAARAGDDLRGPLAGEVRATVALHDARFAMVPFVLRLPAPTPAAPAGAATATVRLAIVDARLARVAWRGEVVGRGADAPAAAADAADRVAALFAAP